MTVICLPLSRNCGGGVSPLALNFTPIKKLVSVVRGCRGRKNRETETSSPCLMLLLQQQQHLIGLRGNRVHQLSIAEH